MPPLHWHGPQPGSVRRRSIKHRARGSSAAENRPVKHIPVFYGMFVLVFSFLNLTNLTLPHALVFASFFFVLCFLVLSLLWLCSKTPKA